MTITTKDYVVTCNIYEFRNSLLIGVTTAEATVATHGQGVPLSLLMEIEQQMLEMLEELGIDAVVLFKGIAPLEGSHP